MKFIVKAKIDAPPAYATRTFEKDGKPLAKGDEIELSAQGYEFVMSEVYKNHAGADAFEFVRHVPFYDHERAFVEREEERARLEGLKKGELLKEAEKLGANVPAGALKSEILETVTTAAEAKITSAPAPETKSTTKAGKK